MQEAGSGQVRDKERVRLEELIRRVNDLFEGEITEGDRLRYVNDVMGKLMESETLERQARHNTKEQFSASPDLNAEIESAIIDAFAAHATMSKQALDSARVRQGLKEILLGPAKLYEMLKGKGEAHDDAGARP